MPTLYVVAGRGTINIVCAFGIGISTAQHSVRSVRECARANRGRVRLSHRVTCKRLLHTLSC